MNIAICDDSAEFTSEMEEYFESNGAIKICDVFYSGEELIEMYKKGYGNYDAIFLDMEMKNMNGIETGNEIRRLDKHVIIVFITGYTSYMQKSFECAPFRFLVKPLSSEVLDKTIESVEKKLSEEKTTLVFSENRNSVRLLCEDIIYFECQAHYIYIYTVNGTRKILRSMTELQKKLDKSIFTQTHRSFIINLGYIHEIRESEIILYGTDRVIPVSRTYKKQLVSDFINFREKKYLI